MRLRRESQTLLTVAAIFGAVVMAWIIVLWEAGWF